MTGCPWPSDPCSAAPERAGCRESGPPLKEIDYQPREFLEINPAADPIERDGKKGPVMREQPAEQSARARDKDPHEAREATLRPVVGVAYYLGTTQDERLLWTSRS